MMTQRSFTEVMLAGTNAVMVFVLLVKLNTSPADVYAKVQATESALRVRTDTIERRQEILAGELDIRRKWFSQLIDAIETAATDRWRRDDEVMTWDEFLEANPDLIPPKQPYEKLPAKLELPRLPEDE